MSAFRRLTIALLLFTLLYVPMWSTGVQGKENVPGLFTSLYMVEPQYGRVLEPINGVTLANDIYMSGIQLGGVSEYPTPNANPPDMIESAHGQVMAIVTSGCPGCSTVHAKYITIRVASLVGEGQIARFHPAVPMVPSYVSDDGKIVGGFGYGGRSSTFYLMGTRRGIVKGSVALSGLCCGATLFDGASRRLYATGATSDHTLAIAAFSAMNGNQVGSLTLQNVPAGSWDVQSKAGVSVLQVHDPGIALSPDGKHIAVFTQGVPDQNQRLSIIDTPSMKVVSSLELSRQQSWLERVGGFLGILPQPALAKGLYESYLLEMHYSRDGQSLYVSGSNTAFDGTGQYTRHDIGVERIDVATGQITGHVLDGTALSWWAQASDGSEIYTLSTADPTTDLCPCTLRAHDPVTLQTTAQRTFDGYSMVHLFIVG
jgi:hypothetical protein